MDHAVISALVGLVGAAGNNGKSPDTDRILLNALRLAFSPVLSDEERAQCLTAIRADKHAIAPGCSACASPCGNTSDLPLSAFSRKTAQPGGAGYELLRRASVRAGETDTANAAPKELDALYRAVSAFGSDLPDETLLQLTEELSPSRERISS